MKRITIKFILLFILFYRFSANAEVPQLPVDWYSGPEDTPASTSVGNDFLPTMPWAKKDKTEKLIKSIYETNLSVMDQTPEKKNTTAPVTTIPNWTPWHLETFTTELSVVGSGLIGVLTGKGTATAQAYWRKHRPPETKPARMLPEEEPSSIPTLNIENVTSESSITTQIEPMIKAALATKKIQNETAFRKNTETAAVEFFNLVNGIQDEPSSRWWVSGFRIEFTVSASGVLTPAVPVATVGGDVRLRFDWRRLSRTQAPRLMQNKLAKNFSGVLGFSGSQSKLQGDLQDLVFRLSEDLNSAVDEDLKNKGFKPYIFRFGLTFTAAGNVGIAKSSASALAGIVLNADVNDPARSFVSSKHDGDILLIEKNPSEEHLQFASNNLVPVSVESNKAKAVYKLNRENLKKGLRKAVKMGNFFISAGQKANSKKWKLYQMKLGVEFSITGSVALVKYSGTSTAEFGFYNMKF
ncbi:MAG: hypothetical protein ACXVCP_13050 [Bdellovibrio sp.]